MESLFAPGQFFFFGSSLFSIVLILGIARSASPGTALKVFRNYHLSAGAQFGDRV